MVLPDTSSLVLALTEDGAPQLLRQPGEAHAVFLGYDPVAGRLVEIHRHGPEPALGILHARTLRERLALAQRLYHPGVTLILECGPAPESGLYVATEYADGECLLDYLRRNDSLPRNLGIHLAIQLAEVAGYLADFPRLLATLRPGDFSVCLDRGHRLRLRLTNLGLERDDQPVSDAELGAYWIEAVGVVLETVLEKRPWPDAAEFAEIAPGKFQLSGPLRDLIERLQHEPGPTAIHELRQLRTAILLAAGFSPIGGEHLEPAFSSIVDPEHRPIGPLTRLITDSVEWETLARTRWRLRDEHYRSDGWSPFLQQARTHRESSATLQDRGDRQDLMLLPPERFVGNAQAARLNYQMGHSYLREHPSLVRARSIHCDADFTLVASPGGNGFTLCEWVARRGAISPADAISLAGQLCRLLAHLDGAELGLDRIDPWRVLFQFDEAVTAGQLLDLATGCPFSEWPRPTLRLRPVSPTDALLAPEAGSWRHVMGRMRDKCLPALILWSLEADRFDELLAAGRAADAPLSESPEIADLFAKAAAHLDASHAGHRRKFLELLQVAIEAAPASERPRPPSDEPVAHDAEVIPPTETPRRRPWRFGRTVPAE